MKTKPLATPKPTTSNDNVQICRGCDKGWPGLPNMGLPLNGCPNCDGTRHCLCGHLLIDHESGACKHCACVNVRAQR